jgi:hypothetical protein
MAASWLSVSLVFAAAEPNMRTSSVLALAAALASALGKHAGGDPYTDFPLPPSKDTISVRMLDSFYSEIPSSLFFAPDPTAPTPPLVQLAGWAFLLEHARTGRRVLFDLGMRHDFNNLAPAVVEQYGTLPMNISEDVPTQLVKGNISLSSIDSIIWRSVLSERIECAVLTRSAVTRTLTMSGI